MCRVCEKHMHARRLRADICGRQYRVCKHTCHVQLPTCILLDRTALHHAAIHACRERNLFSGLVRLNEILSTSQILDNIGRGAARLPLDRLVRTAANVRGEQYILHALERVRRLHRLVA